jgi:hypothetical protein
MSYDPSYIKWVQRSLNRLIGSAMVVNGNPDVGKYREELGKYKTSRTLEEPGLKIDQIGKKCQNSIIMENMTFADGGAYIGWLKKVLPSVGPAANLPSHFDQPVRDFQINENKKPGVNLEVDGVVGPKTELRLIELFKVEPPGSVPTDTSEAPQIDAFIKSLNSMPKDKRYGFMMNVTADYYAKPEGMWHPGIKELAQRLRAHDVYGIPGQYFFTKGNVRYLCYGDPSIQESEYAGEGKIRKIPANPKDPLNKLKLLIKPANSIFGYAYYDVNDPKVQEILKRHFMYSASAMLHPFYAYPFTSRAHYDRQMEKFRHEILEIYKMVDLGIGEIYKLRGQSHGEPSMRLAQALAKGLSRDHRHIYGAFKSQMPPEWWQYESPLPVGRKY